MTTDTTESDADNETEGLTETVRNAIRGLQENATVEKAYGDPIESSGKTIIPVARIVYGFGAGAGSGPETDEEQGEGSGGGGGLVTQPIGVLEITEEETRFVRFANLKQLGLAAGIGILLGFLLGKR